MSTCERRQILTKECLPALPSKREALFAWLVPELVCEEWAREERKTSWTEKGSIV